MPIAMFSVFCLTIIVSRHGCRENVSKPSVLDSPTNLSAISRQRMMRDLYDEADLAMQADPRFGKPKYPVGTTFKTR